MDEEFKEATSGDVVKFEKEGDCMQGIYKGYSESKQYPKSYGVSIETKEGLKVVFVSSIVTDKIDTHSIKVGQEIKIEYLGKQKTKDGSKEYNDYKVLFR